MTMAQSNRAADYSPDNGSESTWQIVRREISRAPRDSRRRVWWVASGFVLTLAIVMLDAFTGSPGLEPYRLFAAVLATAAFVMLAIANVLQALGSGLAPSARKLLDDSQPRFNRMLSVLPVITLTASLLFAAASGIFLSSLSVNLLFLLPIAIFLISGIQAAGESARTSRFLYRYARKQEQFIERAEAEATSARLAALQAQLNPHFLFNALNTVASLVRTDTLAAERTVENLAEILRRTLSRSERPVTTIRDEVDYLRAYLSIERERWDGCLQVHWQIDPDVLEDTVPSMILQPLVENSLRHGIGKRIEGGLLRVYALRADGGVSLGVWDDGAGFPSRHIEGTGIGNLRRRLQTLYGEGAELRINSRPGDSDVSVRVPLPRATGNLDARFDSR